MSVLNEIANIGVGHASTSLAKLCDSEFRIEVPQILPISFDRLHELIPSKPSDYAVVYMAIEGEFSGRMAFFIDWKSCQALWRILIGYAPESTQDLEELESSALVETGNIINGSFLSALNEFANMTASATPPILAIDSFESIISSIAAESMENHVALFIETKLYDFADSVSGSFLLLPSQGSVEQLWEKLDLMEAA
jgi:chemotaxis protein CheC